MAYGSQRGRAKVRKRVERYVRRDGSSVVRALYEVFVPIGKKLGRGRQAAERLRIRINEFLDDNY